LGRDGGASLQKLLTELGEVLDDARFESKEQALDAALQRLAEKLSAGPEEAADMKSFLTLLVDSDPELFDMFFRKSPAKGAAPEGVIRKRGR
jgi:succinate dehydrogenase flavin-adding protein (antitoxin of CptAB toxin-antitoxin module)